MSATAARTTAPSTLTSDAHLAAVGSRAGDLVADYDQVRTWSDPVARQCELTRIGAQAVDLLRQLGPPPSGAGGRQ